MGDRGSIELKQNGGSTFIYVHWLAYETPKILARALDKGRHDDPPYMAGSIMREFVREAGIDESTGLGITPTYQDGVKWEVDLENKTVSPPDQDSPWSAQRSASPISYAEFTASVAAGKDYGYGL